MRWAPFVVPLAYLAAIYHLQADDYLGAPEGAEWAHQRFFDDYDMTAIALRGLNATLGRTAGRTDVPPDVDHREYDRALLEDRQLEAHYYLEYPHATLLLFRLGFIGRPLPPVPAALLDGGYGNVCRHWPAGDGEEALWRRFRTAIRIYEALMVLCFFGLVLTLRAGYDTAGNLSSSGLLLLLPAALFFSVNRFDIVPTLLTALSLACLGRRWVVASACFLAAGVMVKVFPALLAPLVLRYLLPDRKSALRWGAAFAVTGLALLAWPLLREGWQAVWAPYKFQLNRERFGWTAYGYILPLELAETTWWAKAFRLGTLLLAGVALVARPVPDMASLLRRGAVLLIVFVTLPVFYSPQWVLWLMPLLLPLGRRQFGLLVLVVALDVVTYINWPFLGSADNPWLGMWEPP
ncbi:MAG TPA: hypothetical protein VFE78_17550, partial [Gemmataceae bacterium]|nr:hypothetical protein [Gemmataceae bacterium]